VEVIVKNVIALLVTLFLFSCQRAENPSDRPVNATMSPSAAHVDLARQVVAAPLAVPDRGAAAGLMAAPADAAAPASVVPPMIVRTAQMRIIVGDTTKTVDAVTKAVEAMGGFVSGSNIWREGELLRATLNLRVPADKLTAVLSSIRTLARRVDTETISSQDVSQEYVDLDSQLRNLEATETELRELLIVARKNSKKASDVLEVHEQLTMIRGQIEQAKGRMRYLSQVAALSSISLEVVPDAITQPVVERGWEPVVIARHAAGALVGALQSVATAGIWFLIYVVPIFGILGLLIAALWKIARRARPKEA
jgi:hypothetical protein